MDNDGLDGFDIIKDEPMPNIVPMPPPKRRSVNGMKPYELILARDITATATAKTFLIDGFLASEEVSIWYGAPECGKSTAMIDAACHVAAGLTWCGRTVTQGPVLYVAAERGQLVMRRVLAWRLHHGIDDFPLAVINDVVDLRTGRVDADRIIEAASALSAQCGQPVTWVIFDTLSRVLAGGDENSSKDMGSLVLSVDHIHRETKAHGSLLHHVPLGSPDRLRGHGALLGATDITVRIEKAAGLVNLKVDKANDLADEEKPQHAFRFKSITLSEDRTASVLIADTTAAKPAKSKPPRAKLSTRQKLALDALNNCAAGIGKPPPANFELPKGLLAVTLDEWKEELLRSGVIESDHSNKREAFRQIKNGLREKSYAGERDGLVWPVRLT